MNEADTLQILRDRAIRLARTDTSEKEAQKRVVVFALSGERYGLDIDSVIEIFTPDSVTPVPGAPGAILGVTNLRGDIITVINLVEALGLTAETEPRNRQVILSGADGIVAGFMVDQILGIWDIGVSAIDPPLNTIEKIRAEHLLGEFKLADDLVGLLNAPNILEAGDNV